MGYRSETVLKIRKDHYIKLLESAPDKKFLAAQKDDGATVTITWKAVNWDERYPEVQHLEEYLDGMVEDDCEDDFGFMSLGEADNDVEERGIPWDFGIRLRRSLEY